MSTLYKDFTNNILVGVSEVYVNSVFSPTHQAVDMSPAVALKTPEKARISMIYTSPTSGVCVELEHGQGFTTVYKHLVTGSVHGRVGDVVDKSYIFAKAGNTGSLSKGAHAHYEVRIKGIAQDPIPFLQGKKVIPPYVVVETDLVVKSVMPVLHTITASNIRSAGGLGAPVLAETEVGQDYPYLGKTKLTNGFEWARVDYNGVIGYIALNSLWNTIINPPPVEVYKPFEGSFDKDGMSCKVIIKPLQK